MFHHSKIITAATMLVASNALHAAVIINEVDYDQPGTDNAEFIELHNTADSDVLLDGFHLDLINGSSASAYRSIDLSGFELAANDYLVLCSDSSLVMNCDYQFISSSSWLQNGAPDGVALYSSFGLVDSMTYEGEIAGFTEGSALTLADSNSLIMSLARIPNATDSDNNLLDFASACITPGSMNIAGSGDCSMPAVSPVPVPGAVWLFASGLLGLAGVARRSRSAD